MLSLLVLPVLFFMYVQEWNRARIKHAITVYMVNPGWTRLNPDIATTPPKRNYTEILISGNLQDDHTKLDFAQIRIREIVAAKDSVSGLHFHFTDSAAYGSFVKAIDFLQVEGAKTYYTYDRDIWFFDVPPEPPVQRLECGFTCEPLTILPVVPWWTVVKNELLLIWVNAWELIVAFAAFLIGIIVFRKR